MIDTNLKYQVKAASQEGIYLHLKECDNNFIPPLSQKVDLHEYSKKLAEKAVTFEAWKGKALIGLVAAYFNDAESGSGFITNVSVTENYCDKGLASRLMSNCIEYAIQHNINNITLEVSNYNNEAIRLYKKFHFTIFQDKGDLIMMRLLIKE